MTVDLPSPTVVRKHPLAECERCPLYDRGKHVPSEPPTGEGNGLAFIGESPGHKEKLKGRPFIGPSGRLLERVMLQHGIERSASLLTNAALCNYADDDKASLPGAIDACRPRLLADLAQSNVTTAVTLGNSAVSSVYETKVGITKLRGGEAKDSTFVDGLKVVPTFHPAAALRNQGLFPLILQDVAKVVPKVATWVEPLTTVIEDKWEALQFLKTNQTKYPVIVDVETGTEKEQGFNRTTNLLCVGLGSTAPNHGNSVVVIGRPAIYSRKVQKALIRLLSRTNVICQNGKFDVYILSLINHENLPLWLEFDTMLASYSFNENPGTHSLDYMGVEYLGTPNWKDAVKPYLVKHKYPADVVQAARDHLIEWLAGTEDDEYPEEFPFKADIVKRAPHPKACEAAAKEMGVIEFKLEGQKYANRIRWRFPKEAVLLSPPDADGSYASIPAPILHKYNSFDVQVTRMLYFLFKAQQEEKGLTELNKHLMVMSNALMRPERHGLKVDYEQNARLYDEFTEHIDSLDDFTFNVGSWQQLRKHFLDTWGLQMKSTDEDHLTELMNNPRTPDDISKFCAKVLEYRGWVKLRSTYVTSIRTLALANNDVVLPTFKIDQATTGRLASRNPNVQNMPRRFDIKKQFIPSSPDRIFVYADYSQLELRVMCWLADDTVMRDLFNDPTRDVFDELTPAVYGMTKEEFYALKDADPVRANEMRVVIKSFAYGIAYGRTAHGIAQDPKLNITVKEASARMSAFQKQIPAIMDFMSKVVRDIHKGKDLVNVFGRRRRFHLITNQNRHDLEKQAMAYLPQSTASDICVTALSRLPSWMDPRNIIHDAILCEAPREEADIHLKTLIRVMTETAEEVTGGYVSFGADGSMGEDWSKCK